MICLTTCPLSNLPINTIQRYIAYQLLKVQPQDCITLALTIVKVGAQHSILVLSTLITHIMFMVLEELQPKGQYFTSFVTPGYQKVQVTSSIVFQCPPCSSTGVSWYNQIISTLNLSSFSTQTFSFFNIILFSSFYSSSLRNFTLALFISSTTLTTLSSLLPLLSLLLLLLLLPIPSLLFPTIPVLLRLCSHYLSLFLPSSLVSYSNYLPFPSYFLEHIRTLDHKNKYMFQS